MKDELKGNWWNHIKVKDFTFLEKISVSKQHEVELGDILIHKQIQEGDNFPTVVYHKITKEGTEIITNAKAKELLAVSLVEYIKAKGEYPNFCKFDKMFKNGNAQVNYKPTEFDNYSIKLIPAVLNIKDLEAFLKKVKPAKTKTPAGMHEWEIASSSDPNKKYTVAYKDGRWSCTCPSYAYRRKCSHIDKCKGKI